MNLRPISCRSAAAIALAISAGLCAGDNRPATGRAKLAVTTDQGEVGKMLRLWYGEGSAAGNVGDRYDNRDGGHSMLRLSRYPQIEPVTYTAQQKARRLNWGLMYGPPHEGVAFGNSSTAASDIHHGSNARQAMTNRLIPPRLYLHYVRSNLYVYPEHRDCDPGRNGRGGFGDLFPGNLPYVIVSRGSSGSDQWFLDAVACTLAAFRPETKKKLVRTGLLMPTVQMIFRSCNKGLETPEDYLTGRAHPSAFDGREIDKLAMVRMAHSIRPDEIPPMVLLRMVKDFEGKRGRDWFDNAADEVLYDTPCAIARIGRSTRRVRRMVVSVEAGSDVNHRKLTYHWAVLRGDGEQVKIKPLKDDRSVVVLSIPFTSSRPIWPGSKITSPRVDIGAFAHNGKHYSAPAFVTVYFLPNEARTYDAKGRIAEVDYNFGDSTIGYASRLPMHPRYDIADWKPLLEAFAPERDDLPARLLKAKLPPAQAAELARVAREFASVKTPAVRAQVLTKPRPRLGRVLVTPSRRVPIADRTAARTARDCIEQAINAVKDDATLLVDNAAEIERLLGAASQADAKAVREARDKLVRGGVLAGDAKAGWRLTPLLDGDGAPETRLSLSQRNRLEWFHIELINRVLYPGSVRLRFARNFVPKMLTSPKKTWRDVYHYDEAGKLTGWTRHDGGKTTQFNAEGRQADAR